MAKARFGFPLSFASRHYQRGTPAWR